MRASGTIIPLSLLLCSLLAAGCEVGAGRPAEPGLDPAASASGEVEPRIGPPAAEEAVVTTRLRDRDGREVGTAIITETSHGSLVELALDGIPPGVRAVHFHEHGICEPPFESAGDHLNPEDEAHGFRTEGIHLGDLPNVHIPAEGRLRAELFAWRADFDSLLDGDGSALIIHERADDYETDPHGNAGERIACGVVSADAARR